MMIVGLADADRAKSDAGRTRDDAGGAKKKNAGSARGAAGGVRGDSKFASSHHPRRAFDASIR